MNKADLIYLDPPWAFKTHSVLGMDRSAENHYPCMDLRALFDMAPLIKQVTAKDSVMILWVTPPMLEAGMYFMSQAGFQYKSMGGWCKVKDGRPQVGTGYHLRQAMEPFLIGTRGQGYCPDPANRQSSVLYTDHTGAQWVEPEDYFFERGRHSAKPVEFYRYCEAYQVQNYLELFARNTRPGWVSLGNEVDGLDIRESLNRLIRQIEGELCHAEH